MQRIGIIGFFGGNKDFYDGQTIKTKNLEMLLKKYGNYSVFRVDTWLFRTNKVKLLTNTLKSMFICKHIFLLVSVNGMNFYLKFFNIVNKLFKRNIYHYIVGSELLDMVENNPNLVKYLNGLTVNWFEYESGAVFLKNKGVNNAETLSNVKLIVPVNVSEKYICKDNEFKFCTFSRVMEEKGITDAINAIKKINENNHAFKVSLDIYGAVDNSYKEKFEKLLLENKSCVTYKGTVDSFNSVNTLKNYFALLFPTYWAGEGVPGTIIDSFAAGIPVIATDWNANKEVLEHNKQGIIYPNNEINNLEEAILWSVNNQIKMDTMREESRKEFEKYNPEFIFNVINEKIRENDGK